MIQIPWFDSQFRNDIINWTHLVDCDARNNAVGNMDTMFDWNDQLAQED